jgi:polygalacturonase
LGHCGFVIGSNTNGGMANIFVSDCLFSGTDVGLRFITGLPELPVNHIFFDSVVIQAARRLVAAQAKAIDLRNVELDVSEKPVFQIDPTAEIKVH